MSGEDSHNNTHEYLLSVTDKEIKSAIYDLGTMYDRIDGGILSAALWSDRSCQGKDVSNSVYMFLLNAGFVDDGDHYLTPEGKALFELTFIHQDLDEADEYIKQVLLKNPVVNLIGQVFYGRGKISIDQLRVLLNYHKIADWEIKHNEVTSLLMLLNRFGILVYDKKNKCFYIKEPFNVDTSISQYYINPSTPFSNVYNLRKVIRSCKGTIYWIDKHFRKEGFELVLDGLPFEGINTVTIISGTDNLTQSAKTDYIALKEELAARAITLSWRIISDNTFKWHDRWLLSDNQCYNIPPVLAIIRGQRSDILQTKTPLEIQPFLDISVLIDGK